MTKAVEDFLSSNELWLGERQEMEEFAKDMLKTLEEHAGLSIAKEENKTFESLVYLCVSEGWLEARDRIAEIFELAPKVDI